MIYDSLVFICIRSSKKCSSEAKNKELNMLLAATSLIYSEAVCLPDFTAFSINPVNKKGKSPAARRSVAPEVEPLT